MKLQKLFSFLFVAMMTMAFTACNSDDDNSTMQYSNIVTFQGNRDGMSYFTYQEMNDAPAITVRSNNQINEEHVKIGDRVLIIFNLNAGTQLTDNMVLDIVQAVTVKTVVAKPGVVPEDWINANQIYVQALFRSGTWLNMQALVPSTTTEMTVDMVVDPATLGQDNVDLYLIYSNKSDSNVSNAQFFMSFDIKSIWDLASCKSITVHVNNTNGGISAGDLVFRKTN